MDGKEKRLWCDWNLKPRHLNDPTHRYGSLRKYSNDTLQSRHESNWTIYLEREAYRGGTEDARAQQAMGRGTEEQT